MAAKRRGRPPKSPLDPPAGFDPQSKALWRRTIEQLQAADTWADSDVPLLDRYVRAVEVGRLARLRIAARAERDPEGAYVARGSHGGLVPHPDLKTARDAERDAETYAHSLLLSPRSRKQHKMKAPRVGPPSRLEMIIGGVSERAAAAAAERGRRPVDGDLPAA